ncbi:DUF397 domain-containing protein [Streptomyces sp. ME02-8801-2C]|uniref:DUF397 domain-containing protein n=1 Tax=Streptomyces sp. ME02-8801-2C TaxID=3028680 RepID=UPI0029B264F8|nr:DUF397 domain-containing protein [Streptomyces sp. ME02-8801-2C]MDX3457559.1 DUF397 domain-containing protein [Streptomyces sp. ME02-8801-2C]
MSTSELHWFKSSYSDSGEPGDCVEVATTPAVIHIRDSKTPEAPHLTLAPAAWNSFVMHVPGS